MYTYIFTKTYTYAYAYTYLNSGHQDKHHCNYFKVMIIECA